MDQNVYTMEELFEFWESGWITDEKVYSKYEEKLRSLLKEVENDKESVKLKSIIDTYNGIIREQKAERRLQKEEIQLEMDLK